MTNKKFLKNRLASMLLILSVILICDTTLIFTQQFAVPETVGMSYERLHRIDDIADLSVKMREVSGLNLLAARQGKIVYNKSFGMADIEKSVLMNDSTLFRIASMSKPITAVALLILYEEGKLLLTDPVLKYLPEFKSMNVIAVDSTNEDGEIISYHIRSAQNEITIYNLLSHTSGLTYEWAGSDPVSNLYLENGINAGVLPSSETIGDMVQKLSKLPLLFEPETKWEYGLSYDVLGYLVERISGKNLEEFLNQKIFKPLNMKNTFFRVPNSKLANLCGLYTPLEKNRIKKVDTAIAIGTFHFSGDFPYNGKGKYYSGGGGLVSSIGDYYKFLQMLLNNGELNGTRILGKKTVALMTGTLLCDLDIGIKDYQYGLGVAVRTSPGLTSVGEFMWGGIFYTRFFVDPKEKLVGIFMAQLYPYKQLDLHKKFQAMVYQAIID